MSSQSLLFFFAVSNSVVWNYGLGISFCSSLDNCNERFKPNIRGPSGSNFHARSAKRLKLVKCLISSSLAVLCIFLLQFRLCDNFGSRSSTLDHYGVRSLVGYFIHRKLEGFHRCLISKGPSCLPVIFWHVHPHPSRTQAHPLFLVHLSGYAGVVSL